jgi:transposase
MPMPSGPRYAQLEPHQSSQAVAPARSRSGTIEPDRWRIEAAFCRLKDFRRVGTRYDKLAANFASAIALAAVIAFWS